MKQDPVIRSSQRFRSALSPVSKSGPRFKLTLIAVLVCLAAPMMIVAVDDADSTATWNTHSGGISTRHRLPPAKQEINFDQR
jgi:hypothetical protein